MKKEYVHSCYIQNNNCCFGHTIYSNMIQTKTILQLYFSFHDYFVIQIYFTPTIDLFSYTDKKYYLLHNKAILGNLLQGRNHNV